MKPHNGKSMNITSNIFDSSRVTTIILDLRWLIHVDSSNFEQALIPANMLHGANSGLLNIS